MPNFLHESFTSWQLTINVWEYIITLLELCPFYRWKMMCEFILICISLTMNATEHLFTWLRATVLLPLFFTEFLVFSYWLVGELSILWKQTLCLCYELQIFFLLPFGEIFSMLNIYFMTSGCYIRNVFTSLSFLKNLLVIVLFFM